MDIELELRQRLDIIGTASASDWESVLCPCDHGKKGPRAAFLFKNNLISYNCFNCGQTAVLDIDQAHSIPHKFRKILEEFGIDKRTLDAIGFHLFTKNTKKNTGTYSKKPIKQVNIIPKAIDLPKDFVMLDDHLDTTQGKLALAELKHRKISASSYPFMLCIEPSSRTRMQWANRLIIPTFYKDDLVFYQGQDLTKRSITKYLNASSKDLKRANIISNYDIINIRTDKPIYVVEGWYDAFNIGAVALYGNRIHDNQQIWLNKSRRPKVYIPDRSGDGAEIALECLSMGWQVSVPYKGLDDHVKDISDMVTTYGKLFTLKRIIESTSTSEFDGKVKVGLLTK